MGHLEVKGWEIGRMQVRGVEEEARRSPGTTGELRHQSRVRRPRLGKAGQRNRRANHCLGPANKRG